MDAANQTTSDKLIDAAAANPASGKYTGEERRGCKRHPYSADATLVLLSEDGRPQKPLSVKGKDLSNGGVCIQTRFMIHPGRRGVIHLTRSDGRVVPVGVIVSYCRYMGNMLHETGLQFIAIANDISADVSSALKSKPQGKA